MEQDLRNAAGDRTPSESEASEQARVSAEAQPYGYVPAEVRPTGQPGYAQQPTPGTGEPTRRWDTQPGSYAPPYQQVPPQSRPNHTRRVSVLGPVLLIAAGIIFLLNNMGILDWGIWGQLWRLWPIILIAIGLDLLLGRRSPVLSLLIVLLLLGGGAAFLLTTGGVAVPARVLSSNLRVPLDGAKTADVALNIGAGQLEISPMDGGGADLAEGTLAYQENWREPVVSNSVSGDTLKLNINQESRDTAMHIFNSRPDNIIWKLQLNPAIPTALTVHTGAGRSNLDLTSLRITHLALNVGTGDNNIRLPENVDNLQADIEGGVGKVTIDLPEGVAARVRLHSGIGSSNISPRLQKQSGDEDIYQTADYNSASKKIDLRVDVGVGRVEIK